MPTYEEFMRDRAESAVCGFFLTWWMHSGLDQGKEEVREDLWLCLGGG